MKFAFIIKSIHKVVKNDTIFGAILKIISKLKWDDKNI
jgi:hypothetical protein